MENPITNAQLKFNCPINWDEMTDANGGKSCSVCQKKVFDLTNCSQDELDIILIKNNNNICAKFSGQQLMPHPLFPLKRWVSAAVVLLGFNLLSVRAIAQNVKILIDSNNFNNTPIPKGSMGEISITRYDNLPQFPGGVEALNAFLEKYINFNDSEEEVYVQFDIDTMGMVKNFRVVQGLKPVNEEEAARIVKLSPQWAPAKLYGKPVRLNYTLHIAIKRAGIQ